MTASWGTLDLRLDPWDTDFGAAAVFDAFDSFDPDKVDLDVEVPSEAWAPVAPTGVPPTRRLVFIDGVRRVEARVIALKGNEVIYGAFGSYGAGAVAIDRNEAVVIAEKIDRILVIGSRGGGNEAGSGVQVAQALRFRDMSCAGKDVDAPVQALQNEMRQAEANLAVQYVDTEETLVIADGPLTFAFPVPGVVGFVKRIFDPYLPPSKAQLLATLPAGHRTPLFALRSSRRYARYAWFLRLAQPRRSHSPFAGVVRLEVAENVGTRTAAAIADTTTATLPHFASEAAYDPRAPQNLIPIGGLEARLRHLLGDRRIVRRAIETFMLQEITT